MGNELIWWTRGVNKYPPVLSLPLDYGLINFALYMYVGDDFQIEYEIHSNSTGVCITCTFLDSSTTDCVAVVHQRISQLSSSGLMNIESSHKFNRSDDINTASGCIPDVDLEQYQVGVVGGRLTIETQPNQGVHPFTCAI